MSSEFMPMALDSLARQQSARAAGSGASSRITEEDSGKQAGRERHGPGL